MDARIGQTRVIISSQAKRLLLPDQPIVKGPFVTHMISQAASAVTEVGLFRSECDQEICSSQDLCRTLAEAFTQGAQNPLTAHSGYPWLPVFTCRAWKVEMPIG